MTIYDYLQEGEVVPDACLVAARTLIENNIHVIPLVKGEKMPTADVYSVSKLKQHPLNIQNYEFAFKRDNVDIGIMLTKSMEVVDIDEKHYPGITKKVLTTIEQGWPELHEKLCISITPSKGAHLYYYAEIVGGPPTLAYRNTAPKPVCFIERIDETNKSYIKTAPSQGYYYTQRSPLELEWLSAEERGWLMSVCASFNEVFIPEVKKAEQDREDSPWNVFNKGKDYTYIEEELRERGWQIVEDKGDRIVVKRPGSEQRQSGSIWKESAALYLFTAASEFDAGKAYSPFGVYAHYYHDGDIRRATKALASEGVGIDNTTEGQFWRKEGKKIVVKYTELLNWLTAIGYRKYETEIVQVINNRVRIADYSDLKTAFLQEVEPDMADHFFERVSTIFADNGGLLASMPKLPDQFLKDTKETTWLFYLNCAIKVTAAGIDQILYNQLDGLIWDNSIIQRQFHPADFTDFDIQKFIHILGGDNYSKLEQLIGYTISRYKDPMVTRAVVLMEDIDAENEGESQGRSGKGLVFQIISQFRKACRINGKSISFHDAFLWQNVDLDTELIFIDDVEKNFPFTKLYSVITEGVAVNKKGVKQIFVPYNRSPKIFITSNFAVGNMDDSTKDRKYEFPVVKHFSAYHKPVDEFGRPFFVSWSEEDWNKFDCYILHCAQTFLQIPGHEISVTTENSIDRSLIHDTSKEFVEFMDDELGNNFFYFAPAMVKNKTVTQNGVTITNAVNVEQLAHHPTNPDYYLTTDKQAFLEHITTITKYKNLSMVTLGRWMSKWGHVRGVKIDGGYKRTSSAKREFRVEWFGGLDGIEPEQPPF